MGNWNRQKLVSLIPEASEFDWVPDLTPAGWIYYAGTPGQAIAYANLFWPKFVEHDGCILRDEAFDIDNFNTWMQSTNGNRRAVEAVINHVHILDIFGDQAATPTLEQVLCLGQFLRATWEAKLRLEFPSSEITVSFPEDPEPDLINYEITFFQNRCND
ncbi:MAG TPA: hypothetical protein VIY48_13925 [Candidatus Paceibacterota bacterium]